MTSAAGVGLRRLEKALGMAFGRHPDTAVLPADRSGRTPRQAFEDVIRDALSRPPCLVSFSGGRDSSALLALATHVARRDGLQLPVPATLVFPEDEESEEGDWQRQVLSHLGLRDVVTVLVRGDEFDAVGPVAQEVLQQHGQLWPFNVHFHLPIVRAARGGSLITGFGGDELAMSSRIARAERLIARRRLDHRRDVLTVGLRVAPLPVRYVPELWRAGRQLSTRPWLTPLGRSAAQVAYARVNAGMPLGWGRLLRRWMWRSRYFRVTEASFALMAAPYDVRVASPFTAAATLGALAAHAPLTGVGGRSSLMRLLVGDLLPEAVVTRRSKAVFSNSLWTDTAVQFAREWDGAGVDHRLVDPERLRAAWLQQQTASSATLLQQAWLHTHVRAS